MQKKKIIMIMTILMLLCMGVVFFVAKQIPILQQKIIGKQESRELISNYLKNVPTNRIENTEALEILNAEREIDEDILYSYRASEGFELISYSEKWNTDKLIALYEELLKNKHGKEIESLYQIIVYAKPSKTAAGTHTNETKMLYFDIQFPALSKKSSIKFARNMGTIELYDGDKNTTIESMAYILSHEYGHHYTFSYMFQDDVIRGSDYDLIRNISNRKVRYNWWEDSQHYYENHQWYLIEIAAEDYVQLMGSPTTKNIIDYKDVNQILHGATYPKNWYSRNGTPQENLLIPLANEVEGLYDYFYQFISDDYPPDLPLRDRLPIEIKINKGSSSHESVSGPLYFTHYKVSWNDPYKGEDVIYTLVMFMEEDYYLYPIKTVHPGQNTMAYLGGISYESSQYIHWNNDELASGTKTFVVTALFADGTMRVSDPLTYTFD